MSLLSRGGGEGDGVKLGHKARPPPVTAARECVSTSVRDIFTGTSRLFPALQPLVGTKNSVCNKASGKFLQNKAGTLSQNTIFFINFNQVILPKPNISTSSSQHKIDN